MKHDLHLYGDEEKRTKNGEAITVNSPRVS